MRRVYFGMAVLMLFSFSAIVSANDLAFYSGPTNPGWISDAAVAENVKTIENDAGIKSLFNSITNFGDGDEEGDDSPLAKWCVEHTGNGQQDVIILACGTTPSALYQFPNKDPDGSNVENFIEEGNVVINVADWIFYMSYEGGVRSPDNGRDGAANVFDIPGLGFDDAGGQEYKPNALGKDVIPSMEPFISTRPWHLDQFDGSDWDVVPFAEAGGTADPAVAISKSPGGDGTGMIAAMWQVGAPNWPGDDIRGIGVAEFINNWLSVNGTFDVEAKNKLATTWGTLKQTR